MKRLWPIMTVSSEKGPRRSSLTSAGRFQSGRKGSGNGSFESVGWDEARPVIGIVGGGFSGAMVAVQLARQAGPNPPRVVLFEKTERLARGLAYGTQCDQHLLNVPAGLMSALPDEPSHFLNWLQNRDPSAQQGTFASRRVYGDYLKELLTSTAKASATQIEFAPRRSHRPGVRRWPRSPVLSTRQGNRLEADKVILALGHPKPQTPEGLENPSMRRRLSSPIRGQPVQLTVWKRTSPLC